MDEPFSGLDPVNVELLKEAVKDLNDWVIESFIVLTVWSMLKNYVMMFVF